MALKIGFFSTPREVRHIIYRYYLAEEDGYHFDFESRTLRARNQPIDLALLYASRQTATEMQGLAFEFNTITFSTACPRGRSERLKAGRYDRIMHELELAKLRAVSSTGHPDLRHFRTPEIMAELSRKWKCYTADFELLDARIDEEDHWGTAFAQYPGSLPTESSCGEASSEHLEFINHALKLFSNQPAFVEALAACDTTLQPSFARSQWLSSSPSQWALPTEDQIFELEKLLAPRQVKSCKGMSISRRWSDEVDNFWKTIRGRYSACAIAVTFLQSLSPTMRLHMRKIVLNEDRDSICRPECHAYGLLGFCLENSALHIERRVNLWRNMFPAKSDLSVYDILNPLDPEDPMWSYNPSVIHTDLISNSIGDWLTEALALSAAGMPAQSFTLVFDGNPALEQSSALFEIVKWDASWQVAYDEWQRSRPDPQTFEDWESIRAWDYPHKCHRFDAFLRLSWTLSQATPLSSAISLSMSRGSWRRLRAGYWKPKSLFAIHMNGS